MDYDKKYEKHRSLCLECGSVIGYGRTDKKYCCEGCKNRHHNHMAKTSRAFRNRILKAMDRNYEILDELVKSGTETVDLTELIAIGFIPGMVTSYLKSGKHAILSCYDIKYRMTATHLYAITRIHNISGPTNH